MKFSETHGGNAGKTLAQKMRDRTDELYADWMNHPGHKEGADIKQGMVEGACEMLAILCSTTADLQWNSTEARYDDNERRKQNNRADSETD